MGKNAFTPIAKAMTRNRFDAIKKYLCFENDDDRKRKGEPGYDPLFRLRKVADELNKTFDSIPKPARLCVDEQMCSTKTVHHLRQYMPNKPHKWGGETVCSVLHQWIRVQIRSVQRRWR